MDARGWKRRLVAACALAVLAIGLADCRSTPAPGLVQTNACADFTFPIYFQSGSDQLTPEALQLVAESVTRAKGCLLGAVTIKGLGGADKNLAARRAGAVIAALSANGLARPAPQVDPTSPAQAIGLIHRRAEVHIHFATSP